LIDLQEWYKSQKLTYMHFICKSTTNRPSSETKTSILPSFLPYK
jgi:hypothetical protein